MPDLVTEVRRAVLIRLKNDPAVTELVPAASIYPQSPPALPSSPFIKTGVLIASPHAGRRDGRSVRVPIYIRANALPSMTGEDHIGLIAGAVAESLYRARLSVLGGTAKFTLINDIRRQVDGEASAYEANIEFRANLIAGAA